MSEIQDYMIYRFLMGRNGKASKQEIMNALAKNEEEKRIVEEKLSMMERFGLIKIEGNRIIIKER